MSISKPLQPGAELDAEVAKAMGWKDVSAENTLPYSTDMGAAWQLIGYATCIWTWEIRGPLLSEGSRWRCEIFLGLPGVKNVCEFADSAPEAICRAFLAAVASGRKERR